MTPKEKAKFIFLEHLETLKPLGIIGSPAKKTAKRNLVITVDELIKLYEYERPHRGFKISYWDEVKQEIELL
jgi:hypothetical protein